MKNARHNAQLGIPTLGVVFVHVAHMWRIVQPETENQALYDDLFSDTVGLVFRGAVVESVSYNARAENAGLSQDPARSHQARSMEKGGGVVILLLVLVV